MVRQEGQWQRSGTQCSVLVAPDDQGDVVVQKHAEAEASRTLVHLECDLVVGEDGSIAGEEVEVEAVT